MARIIRTARGESVDFDAIMIKQQLAQAPMNIEVEKRKRFIDSREEKPKRSFIDHNATNEPTVNVVLPPDVPTVARADADFEPEGQPVARAPMDGPIPVIPARKKA